MQKLQINLKSSRYVALWLIIIHLAALFLILFEIIDGAFSWYCLLAIGFIGYSFYYYWRLHSLQHWQAIICLQWVPGAVDWLLYTQDKRIHFVELMPDSICTTAIVLLKFKSKTRKKVFWVLIPRDAVALAEYKYLQRLMRLQVKQLLELS